MKKQLLIFLASLSVACTATGAALSQPLLKKAKAEDASALKYDFTDTMDGADFAAPASNYGWKVTKGALAPDNSITPNKQIGYLEQAIALNVPKYISMDFYAQTSSFDVALVPCAETLDPWATGIGVHSNESGWMTLNTNIDLGPGWLADYTGIGNGVDGYAHKLEITSDGTNLTFKVDGMDAFTSVTVAIPADSVQLFLRAEEGSYIDNLYIGAEKPVETETATYVDFTDKTDLNDFTSMALSGWTGGNGKYHPVDEGAWSNASAAKLNEVLDLTGTKYISFDFYATEASFDVGLLDTNATNIWGNALYIHVPYRDGQTIGIDNNVDSSGTSYQYYDGISIGCIDGKAHTLEIFVNNGKVSYALDGTALVGNGGTTEYDVPADNAYLVFRAVGTASYIDNLYVADSAPAASVDYDFDSVKDGLEFANWNSAGWSAQNGGFAVNADWASTQLNTALDLTKNQEITFDVFLSSADTNKQFNVAFVSEENLATATTEGAGVGFSLGSTLWLGTNLGRAGWIADAAANLYNDTWHSVKISVTDGKISIAVDGVAYDALTADIPANTAYMLLQSTHVKNVLDNLKIVVEESEAVVPTMYEITFQNWDGTVLQSGSVEEGQTPVYEGATPTKDADENYTYTFKGWDKEIVAATGNAVYVAQFDATEIPEEITYYTVTFQNWDGTVLQSGSVEEGQTPVYEGATPTKDTDMDYIYTFKGWDKEIVAATGDTVYVAQFDATEIVPEYVDTMDLDFSDATQANEFFAYGGSAGWSIVDGVFKPNANWATVNTGKLLDLTKDQQITFDVYLSSSEVSDVNKQFNVGFFETTNADTNTQAGSGVNYSFGETLFYGSSYSRVNWVADVAATLYNDTVHSVKIVVKEGKLSIAVDGVAYDTLTADIPAESVFLLLQSTSTETYVDNLKIGELVEEIPEVNPYEGVFEKYGSGAGWSYADEKLAPNAAWSVINTVNQIDFTKNQEITFDVYLSSADADKQFNVGFFETKVEETNAQANTGLSFSFGGTIWVSTNFGRGGWASECVKDYFDNSLHSVKLTIINKEITVTVDGEVLYFLTNGEAYTPTLTVDAAYLLMQGTSTETYIQNYEVKEVEAVAPTTYTVTFKNWDGAVLQSSTIEEGAVPNYAGATPEKAADADYIYTFKGWDKELTAVTGDVVYVAQFDATEIPDEAVYYTVTFENWDGTELQSGSVLEGLTPVYEGEVPMKAADADYTYTFKGWDKELTAVTGDVVYVAQFTATPIPVVETIDEIELDFEDETQLENVTAIANDGWTVRDGKYYPAQAGVMYNASAFQLNKALDLTGTKYVSIDFYSTAKTFDIGLLDVSAGNMWGNALFIHLPFADGSIGVNNYVDCTVGTYFGGTAINVMDGAWHNLKIVIDGGKVAYVLDGETILEGFDVPSAKAYLVIRAVGEESYVDNLIVSNEDIEYIPPVIDNSYDELELDFTAELDGAKYFSTLDVNGWAVKDGEFSPEYMPWASTYLKQPVDLSGEKYISFDFFAVKDNGDETQSQFNMMFLTDLTKFTCVGALHCFMESTSPVLTVNQAMGKDNWLGTANFNWADGKYHHVMIIIKDNTITFEVDGKAVVDNITLKPVVIELEESDLAKETYFGLQATNVMSRIDNFKVKNTYTEYVASTPDEEIAFEEFEQSFNADMDTGFVKYHDSVDWIVTEEGHFAASANWAKAYLDKQVPLTDEKTLTTTFKLSSDESGHQFTIGFSQDKNSYYGIYLVFYQGNVTLNYGTAPQVRLISQTANVWYDDAQHVLKMIVKNNKLAIVIDGEVIFKEIQIGMNSGYFTVQSSNTVDWIDDLTIVNDAEPLSTPVADGDIATPPVENEVKNEVVGEVQSKNILTIIVEWFTSLLEKIEEFFAGLFAGKKE